MDIMDGNLQFAAFDPAVDHRLEPVELFVEQRPAADNLRPRTICGGLIVPVLVLMRGNQ